MSANHDERGRHKLKRESRSRAGILQKEEKKGPSTIGSEKGPRELTWRKEGTDHHWQHRKPDQRGGRKNELSLSKVL